jgi:hypothetical protein
MLLEQKSNGVFQDRAGHDRSKLSKLAQRHGRQDGRARHRAGRKLFRSIDTAHIVGFRDRAVFGVRAYTAPASGSRPTTRHDKTWSGFICVVGQKRQDRDQKWEAITNAPVRLERICGADKKWLMSGVNGA